MSHVPSWMQHSTARTEGLGCIKSHINASCHTYEGVVSHVNTSCHADMNKSCHLLDSTQHCATRRGWGASSHIWVRHVTHMNESCHIRMLGCIKSHMNASCHIYEWVKSRMDLLNHAYMNESCPILDTAQHCATRKGWGAASHI